VLYSPVIRDRFRSPRHRGRIEQPDAAWEDVNPLCGDRIRIECRVPDGRILDARFSGDSCAICMASADVLLEMMIGQPVESLAQIRPETLLERLEARIRASRMKCVTLPLSVLRAALAGRGRPA
jgi:nitrogen fixation NifU-like protein